MSYGPMKKYSVSIASAATSSGGADLGRSYSQVYLEIPSATTFNLTIQGSIDGTSFKRIYHSPSDGDAVVTSVEITSATAGTNGAIVKLPCIYPYMRVESGTAVANGMSLNFLCVD